MWGSLTIADHVHSPHQHGMHELMVYLNDQGAHCINGHRCDVMRGGMAFMPGDSSHYLIGSVETPTELAFFCFDRLYFEQKNMHHIQAIVQELEQSAVYFAKAGAVNPDETVILAKKIAYEIEHPRVFSVEKADAMMAELLIEFHRSTGTPAGTGDAGSSRIEALCRTIAESPERAISVAEACRITSLSRTAFLTAFKSHTGSTFVQFQQKARIRKAMELLGKQRQTIADAALASGFQNLGHFHKIFKRQCGMTPRQFRVTFGDRALFPELLDF